MPSFGHQYQHGVRKNLVEGIGGLIVGAAAILLLTRLFKKNQSAATAQPAPASPEPPTSPGATSGAKAAPKRASRRTKAAR